MADQDDFKEKRLGLECPFTWDMMDYHTDVEVNRCYDEDYIPEIKFMRLIVSAYNKMTKLQYVEAEENLKEAEEVLKALEISKIEVAKHILDASKLHIVIIKGEHLEDIGKLLEKIKTIRDEAYDYQLNEFKACAWHCGKSHISNLKNALKFSKLALEKNPESALSHFLVANIMKFQRKYESIRNYSSSEERKHFTKAYELSKNPHIGITFAVVLRQDGNQKKAFEICKEIYELNLESTAMQLRLAANFSHLNEYQLARKCLDFVEQRTPNDPVFLHYKGQYLMKTENFLESAILLKKACDEGRNYAVEMTYANCIKKLKFPFNFVAFFKEVYEKYSEDSENFRKQEMLLHIAFSNFFDNADTPKATKYFLKACEIDAGSIVLKKYRCPLTGYFCNVYRFMETDIFPKIYTMDRICDETIAAMKRLKYYYNQYKADMMNRESLYVEKGVASLSMDTNESTTL